MGKGLASFGVLTLVTAALMAGDVAVAERLETTIRLPFETIGDATRVTVVKGDHLWKISDRHMSAIYGREALDAEVSPYWRLVIETNRGSLRSGDPNLIYPGEVVTLPPLP